eukprot:CAMPEP_0206286628 /NCGR_PEP_ID=MMETSP0106_2-20121207/698_1 /ASSEMBLY_ACC=CAM_ASM_000206 /TAXON_ID=81532 /ORGANISM="Acanthoeca-like sp., Strain 10tr" /LENGTH=697 /DNA_ID=CAMNT_0053717155 /DNA_START=146 /DNA_END=2240 /DNA_ORIENTATION=+
MADAGMAAAAAVPGGASMGAEASAEPARSHKHAWEAWTAIGSPKFVLAPMTEGSDLPFRLLCRAHGVGLAYTPMLYAEHFASSARYRNDNFSTCETDRPLAVQFCAKSPDIFVAADMVQGECDFIDLNLDWNQAKAEKGGLGAALQPTWDVAVQMVRRGASELDVPVSCKMRLFPTVAESVARASELAAAGCSLLVVHGRTRGAAGARWGVADWEAIAAIKKAMAIPVLANGSVASRADAEACLAATGADGVLLSGALLANPHAIMDERPPAIDVAKEYLALCREHPVSSLVIREHLSRLWWRPMLRFHQIRKDLSDSYTLRSFEIIADELADELSAAEAESASGGLAAGESAMPPLGVCQPTIIQVPTDPSDRAAAQWHRFSGDVNQAELAERVRHALREACPLEDVRYEWQPLLSRKKAKRFVAITRSHLRNLKRKASGSGDAHARTQRIVPHSSNTASAERPAKIARPSIRDRKAERLRMIAAQQPECVALQVAVDLGLGDHQSEKELNKLANQIRRLYGTNMVSRSPAHVHFTGLKEGSRIARVLGRYCDGFESYVATRTPLRHTEFFPRERLVYLTPDSPNPLIELDPSKVYVLGGLVDEHIIKNLTLDAAAEHDIATARLPIAEFATHHEGSRKSQVLACNQVFEVLVTYWVTKSWPDALKPVLPVRKGYFVDAPMASSEACAASAPSVER